MDKPICIQSTIIRKRFFDFNGRSPFTASIVMRTLRNRRCPRHRRKGTVSAAEPQRIIRTEIKPRYDTKEPNSNSAFEGTISGLCRNISLYPVGALFFCLIVARLSSRSLQNLYQIHHWDYCGICNWVRSSIVWWSHRTTFP